MQEQPTPRPNQSTRRFSDEEASEIYKRAAQIESKTLFASDNDTLSRDQLEDAANRAGISDEAVNAAIAQIERERIEAQTQAAAKAKTRRQVLIVGGIIVGLIAINGVLTQRGFSARLADVDTTRANVDTAIQRRQDLIPNIQKLANANLSNERDLITALNRPDVDGATLQLAKQKLEDRGVQSSALDEVAGTENRIAIARRRFSESASEYNRNASSFPASAWRSVFRFPPRIEPSIGDKSTQGASKSD
ncbi:hypothetical protein IAD21_02405 [Abditibacteriota bacterium]|nr:hypothetical protein IAD21_02405 [Abditibacteriota bacterium]